MAHLPFNSTISTGKKATHNCRGVILKHCIGKFGTIWFGIETVRLCRWIDSTINTHAYVNKRREFSSSFFLQRFRTAMTYYLGDIVVEPTYNFWSSTSIYSTNEWYLCVCREFKQFGSQQAYTAIYRFKHLNRFYRKFRFDLAVNVE